MYPVLFHIGSLEITSFGVMVALGTLAGLVLMRHEMIVANLDGVAGTDAALVSVLGGLAGAKLLYVFEHIDEGLRVTLLNRGGMSWFGGLAGGLAAGLAIVWWRRLRVLPMLAAAAPALALGQGIGRVGCFLVGDDYGTPTGLPWGVSFPRGLPPTLDRVHPTQLYEAGALFFVTWLLVQWRRTGIPDDGRFGRYLVLAGLLRFLIEFIRTNVPVLLGLTTAQLFALGALAVGIVVVAAGKRGAGAPVLGG